MKHYSDPRAMTYDQLVSQLTWVKTAQAEKEQKHEALMEIGRYAYSSLAEMVSAADLDWDRLEELEEAAKAPRYIVGRNMPGYVPDHPGDAYDNVHDAREALADTIEEYANDIEPDPEQPDSADTLAVQALREKIAHIREQVGILRLPLAPEAREEYEFGETFMNWHFWLKRDGFMIDESPDDVEELEDLRLKAGTYESADEARQAITDDPLSVRYRSGWSDAGYLTPEGFEVLLSTGGPATRVIGEVDDDGSIGRCRLEVQDWFTPWTAFHDASSDVLKRYCELLGIGQF